jgi:hypothetical protein
MPMSQDESTIDDSDRYREWLQKSLLTEGWEEVFDYRRLSEWVQENRERLRASARATLGDAASAYEDHFANTVENFSPRGKYDLPMTEEIFRPLFNQVAECAREIGLRPLREVELVTSTSVSPTPFSLSTTGTHQLFIGLGTSLFCNYWAKTYTAIVKAIAAGGPPYERVASAEALRDHLARDPSGILLATRLCLYYAANGTLMGFGKIEQPPDYYAYRTDLLKAMEVFALSHEYAHFLADERGLQFADEAGEVSSYGLEFFCDQMGLQLSRFWGAKNNNWLAFTGVGGLAFFRAVDTCQACAAELLNTGPLASSHAGRRARWEAEQDSHPPVRERALNLISWVIDKTNSAEKVTVESYLTEFDLICTTICTYASDVLREAGTAATPPDKAVS